MELRISRLLLDRIMAEASGSDVEVCGLLVGRGGGIEVAMPCRNIATDPRRRFEIDPAALLAAHRNARVNGTQVMGHYHSHPDGLPLPSACDAAEASADGAIWLIFGADRWRAWRAVADGAVEGRFDPVSLVVTPPCAGESAPPEGPR